MARCLIALCCILALWGRTTEACAQSVQAQPSVQVPPGPWNEAEREAYRLYRNDKPVEARAKAEKVVKQNRESLMGHYVLAAVLFEAEGSLSRAMYHFGKAREIYETRWKPSNRAEDSPWTLHRDLLFQAQNLAGQMELHNYQLELQSYHDYLYDPDLLAERAWPLVRLGRDDEARKFAKQAIASNDSWQRSLGMNALCAVEGEAQTRKPYYLACKAALANAKSRRASGGEQAVAVHAYNAALAALAAGKPSEAISFLEDGASRLEFTPANPWRLLVRIYIDEGKMNEAVDALLNMQRWRKRQPAYLRDQDRAESDAIFGLMMLVGGRTEDGLRAIDRAIDQPDRRGLTSSVREQAVGAHALMRRAMLKTRIERRMEEAASGGFFSRAWAWVECIPDRIKAWMDGRRVSSALADEKRLVATLRPHIQGGLSPIPYWMVGDLVEILGPGVVLDALTEARREDAGIGFVAGHLDAVRAEALLAQGRPVDALKRAALSLERLPAHEALLRARVQGIIAKAARELGKEETEFLALERALRVDGGMLRRMGISLPTKILGSGSLGKKVAEALHRSPRFRSGKAFRIEVYEGKDPKGLDTLKACLNNHRGEKIRCTETVRGPAPKDEDENAEDQDAEKKDKKKPENEQPATPSQSNPNPEKVELENDEQYVERMVRVFQHELFAADVRISQIDMGSLDGRVTSGSEIARERLENMLEYVAE